jgi:kynureninase
MLASMSILDRAAADALDHADPLARFRERFLLPGGDSTIYLNANSLGPLPRATAEQLARAVRDGWGGRGVDAWEEWLDLPARVGDRLGEVALGAAPGQVVLGDSTTVQLYKLASAALEARRDRDVILADRGEFPTDRYVLEGLAASGGRHLCWLEADPREGLEVGEVASALASADVALLCLSLVSYRSGALADLAAITTAAHDAGALVLWDLSHAVGSVEIGLDAARADLAVGCTYKHLNAGPGAPAFAYVRRDLQERLRQPIWGWFGQRGQFAMGPAYDPQPDIRRFLAGTPPVLGLMAVESGVEMIAEAGMAAVRRRAVALTDFAAALHDAWLAPLGVSLAGPTDPARRGGHVSLRHPDAAKLCRLLATEHGVITDFREPDVLRLGPVLLATRFVEVFDALHHLGSLIASVR